MSKKPAPAEKLAELISQTRESAIAVLEDYNRLAGIVVSSETKAVDLRHASAILRRWLVEDALQRVANPRVGRINIPSIDNRPVYVACRTGRIVSFVSGGASVHGIYIAAGMVNAGNRAIDLVGFHPDQRIDLSLESFVRQRVIFTGGTWITRRQVIKFVANIDRGVHDGKVRESDEELLAAYRQQVSVELLDVKKLTTLPEDLPKGIDAIPSVNWTMGDPAARISLASYNPSRVNGVLLELLASMMFLVAAPDIKSLCTAIEKEL
jgi:hypothetical protein